MNKTDKQQNEVFRAVINDFESFQSENGRKIRHPPKRFLWFPILAIVMAFVYLPTFRVSAAADYRTVERLICTYQAPAGEGYAGYAVHVHNNDCYDSYYELCCPLPYIPPHIHTDACYQNEKVLVCGKTETNRHQHSDACYEERKVLVCGQLELHTHTEDCYTDGKLTCGKLELVEHVHDGNCFRTLIVDVDPDTGAEMLVSDPMADVETEEDWEKSVADAELTGDWNRDLVAVAKTQLGYTQSFFNIEVTGEFAGGHYTRYGDWYGYPYGSWCAMFVSFCLHYAGIPEEAFMYESGTISWADMLMRQEQFGKRGEYDPVPGDLVFFDFDGGHADHVGIVIENKNGTLTTIEGNRTASVEEFTYPDYQTLPYIMGFGILPENPERDSSFASAEE